MAKTYLSLTKSERSLILAASQIYAAYIQAGRVSEGEQTAWMDRSVQEALALARICDGAVISDGEMS